MTVAKKAERIKEVEEGIKKIGSEVDELVKKVYDMIDWEIDPDKKRQLYALHELINKIGNSGFDAMAQACVIEFENND